MDLVLLQVFETGRESDLNLVLPTKFFNAFEISIDALTSWLSLLISDKGFDIFKNCQALKYSSLKNLLELQIIELNFPLF